MYAQMPLINVHADASSGARGLNFGPSSPTAIVILYIMLTEKALVNLCIYQDLRVLNRKLFFLFLKQNICCGGSKEPSQ